MFSPRVHSLSSLTCLFHILPSFLVSFHPPRRTDRSPRESGAGRGHRASVPVAAEGRLPDHCAGYMFLDVLPHRQLLRYRRTDGAVRPRTGRWAPLVGVVAPSARCATSSHRVAIRRSTGPSDHGRCPLAGDPGVRHLGSRAAHPQGGRPTGAHRLRRGPRVGFTHPARPGPQPPLAGGDRRRADGLADRTDPERAADQRSAPEAPRRRSSAMPAHSPGSAAAAAHSTRRTGRSPPAARTSCSRRSPRTWPSLRRCDRSDG